MGFNSGFKGLNTKVYWGIRRYGDEAAFIDETNFGSHLTCFVFSKRKISENINTYKYFLCTLVACVKS